MKRLALLLPSCGTRTYSHPGGTGGFFIDFEVD